ELNNPLNNIGLFVGNAIDQIQMNKAGPQQLLRELNNAMQQVGKATEIISHLRTFGRAAPASRQRLFVYEVVQRALSLLQEQMRDRQIVVQLDFAAESPTVVGNSIQLEQVFVNVLTNARDALADSPRKRISISGRSGKEMVELSFQDSGPG